MWIGGCDVLVRYMSRSHAAVSHFSHVIGRVGLQDGPLLPAIMIIVCKFMSVLTLYMPVHAYAYGSHLVLQRIEAPVRGEAPDKQLYGGKDVQDRSWGQDQLNPELRANTADPSKRIGEFAPSDAMR